MPFSTKTLPPLWDHPVYSNNLSTVFIWGETWRWVTLQASRKEKMKTAKSKFPGKQLWFLDTLNLVPLSLFPGWKIPQVGTPLYFTHQITPHTSALLKVLDKAGHCGHRSCNMARNYLQSPSKHPWPHYRHHSSCFGQSPAKSTPQLTKECYQCTPMWREKA